MLHILFLLLLPNLAHLQTPLTSYDDTDGALKKGIIFHEHKKILLAEKFIDIQFLLPFPTFSMQIEKDLQDLTQTLSTMWDMPSFFCHLNYTFNLSMEGFNVNWLLDEIQAEIRAAELDLHKLHVDTASFLTPPTPDAPHDRSKRALPLAAVAAGAIGLFGSGVAIGTSDCGLAGIFGTCQARENAQAIDRLFDMSEQIFSSVYHLKNATDQKFFIVSKELQAIRDIQQQMQDIQNANWKIISEQMQIFKDNIREMRNCDQLLYSRQQINFNFDTVASLLSLYYSNIKAYRAALFAYHINMLNSVPALLSHYVPMSLLDRESLKQVIEVVHYNQIYATDHLSLALPFEDLLSYYEAQLLRDVNTLPHGLLLTMSIPLASSQTTFTVYESIPLPMPQHDSPGTAIMWDLSAPYLAVSDDGRQTATLSSTQLTQCIGSSRYSICHAGLATAERDSSCLSLLFFENLLNAMKFCTVKPLILPPKARATNLKYGIWLIERATDDYRLHEFRVDAPSPLPVTSYDGCHICIITLSCGHKLTGPDLTIFSDLASCRVVPPTYIHVDLPSALSDLLSVLPPLEDLPTYNTKTSANLDLIHTLQNDVTFLQLSQTSSSDDIKAIAQPIAMKMVDLKRPLQKQLSSMSNFTTSLWMGVTSFVISCLLHLLVGYLYHLFTHFKRILPLRHRHPHNDKKIRLRPVLTTDNDDDYLHLKKDPKLHKKTHLLPSSVLADMDIDARYTPLSSAPTHV